MVAHGDADTEVGLLPVAVLNAASWCGEDFGLWRRGRFAWSAGRMFAVAGMLVDLSFPAAEAPRTGAG